MPTPLLEVKNLVTSFHTEMGPLRAVDGVNFSLERGQTLGIVGESGCGKSVSSLSIMRLLPQPSGVIESGEILFDGQDLLQMPPSAIRKIRGNRISMIFQEPMTALNPVHTVGRQIMDVFKLHQTYKKESEKRAAALDMLKKVGIPAPEQRMTEFPHQMSGGMRQRVMIAMALASKPDVLIADEPTTALDVTIQAQILKLIQDLQDEMGMAVIFITHDLGVIAEICDEVVVMYAGKVAEHASVFDIFREPSHPYTQGLLASIPRLTSIPKQKLKTIEGTVPELANLPKGCRFENRCPHREVQCKTQVPLLEKRTSNHEVACHMWESINGFEKLGDE